MSSIPAPPASPGNHHATRALAPLLVSLGLLLPAPASAIGFAVYSCTLQLAGQVPINSGAVGTPCNEYQLAQPVSNITQQQDATVVSSPGTLFTPPVTKVVSNGTGGGLAYGNATLQYEIGLSSLLPPGVALPRVRIPVSASGTVTVRASVSNGWSDTGDGFASAFASLTLRAGPLGDTALVTACKVTERFERCNGLNDSDRLRIEIQTGLALGEVIVVNAAAQARGQGDYSYLLGQPAAFSGEALADPYAWIDPGFMVELNGQMVPANQVFTLVASPGINFVNVMDPAAVPLPPSVWQLGIGMAAVALQKLRTRPRRARAAV